MFHACPSAQAFKFSDMVLLGTSILVAENGLCLKLEISFYLIGVLGNDSIYLRCCAQYTRYLLPVKYFTGSLVPSKFSGKMT